MRLVHIQGWAYNSPLLTGLICQAYVPYVKSLQSLAALQDGETDPANVPIIQLKGLKDIANKFGLKSDELRKAQEMLSITAEVGTYLLE